MPSSHRWFPILPLAVASLTFTWQGFSQEKSPPKIVFVCEHGAAKSVMAAAELERIAKERGLRVIAVARGSNPEPEISPLVRKELKAAGMDLGAAKPSKVSTEDLRGATRVVSFGPDLSTLVPKGTTILDWSATPSPGQNYSASRQYILKQLEEILAGLPK